MKTRSGTQQTETEWMTLEVLILTLLMMAPMASAAVYWTGEGTDSDWTNNANWDVDYPDSYLEVARFDVGPTNTSVTVDQDVTVGALRFFGEISGYALSGPGTITIDPGVLPGGLGLQWATKHADTVIGVDLLLADDIAVSQNVSGSRPVISGDIGEVSAGTSITFWEGRDLSLWGNNSYSGGTIMTDTMTLELGNANALGTGTLTVQNGTTGLQLTEDLAIGNDIVIAQDSDLRLAPFADSKHTLTLNGDISIDATGASITEYDQDATARLEVMGTITDNGNGLTLNSYVSGEILIGGGNAIAGGVTVVNGNGFTETIKVAENTAFGTSGVTFQNLNTGGSITLAPETGTGTGTVTLNNDVTLDLGTTDLILGGNSETIIMNGEISGTGNVEVGGNAVLAGTGSITGNVSIQANGSLSPGNSPGDMTITGDLLFADGTSEYTVDLLNTTAGSGYDQMTVNGAIGLNYASLELVIADGAYFSDEEMAFIMINNGTSVLGSGTGRFAGLGNGTIIDLTAFGGPADSSVQISYFGDYANNSATGGNDIVLYNFINVIPEPSTLAVLLLGLVGLVNRRKRR